MAGAAWCRGGRSKFSLLCSAVGAKRCCEAADLPQGCVCVCARTWAHCLVRVPCGRLLLRSAAPRGPSGVISSPRGACDSGLDALLHMSLVFCPLAAVGAAGEAVMGGSLVQPDGSSGSPNPQLCWLDLAPLKSQRRAAPLGVTQRCVSQFELCCLCCQGLFFSFQLFPSETCLRPSGFDRLLAPLPPPASDTVAETPAISPLPLALPLRFETCWEGLSLQGNQVGGF